MSDVRIMCSIACLAMLILSESTAVNAQNVFPQNGNVGIGTSSPNASFHIDFNQTGSVIAGTPLGNGPGWTFFSPNGRRRDITAYNGGIYIRSSDSDGAPSHSKGGLYIRDNGTVSVGDGDGKTNLEVIGTTRTQVLEITGGSDLAEPFKVSSLDGVEMKIQPGIVLAIDADSPGNLKVSSEPYDRKVAGIVSGANGLSPGLTMKQKGGVADGSIPLALTGRVYVYADSSNGEIHPGDLLTTSNQPGYAMKVTDFDKANGATLGKAMTALENESGLVLVLVGLQ